MLLVAVASMNTTVAAVPLLTYAFTAAAVAPALMVGTLAMPVYAVYSVSSPFSVATRKMVLPLATDTEPISMVELPLVVSIVLVSVVGSVRTFSSY